MSPNVVKANPIKKLHIEGGVGVSLFHHAAMVIDQELHSVTTKE